MIHSFHSEKAFNQLYITNKQDIASASVMYHAGSKAYKRRLAYSVTVKDTYVHTLICILEVLVHMVQTLQVHTYTYARNCSMSNT